MNYGFMSKWGLAWIAVAACIAIVSPAPRCAADEEESGQQAVEPRLKDEIGWLEKRAEAEAQEVNESINQAIKQAELSRQNMYREEELGYVPDINLLSEEELAVFEARRQEKLSAIRARFGGEVNNIEARGIASAKEQPAAAMPQVEERPRPSVSFGTVTGIVLYDKKGAALVAGRVVRANDVIGAVRVVRILQDFVEFEKQGKKWVQQVGETPPAGVWEQKSPASK